jgi:hypothetical protein
VLVGSPRQQRWSVGRPLPNCESHLQRELANVIFEQLTFDDEN